jgi:hypothetical protein
MNFKLPKIEVKQETLWKAASLIFTVGGAIAADQINKQKHEKSKAEMKAEIIKEIFNDQENS